MNSSTHAALAVVSYSITCSAWNNLLRVVVWGRY